jgi:hypothetical protein
MNKREFSACLKRLTTRGKFDVKKIPNLTEAERDGMVKFIVRQRAPIVAALITPGMDCSWLAACAYMHTTISKTTRIEFLHTAEQRIL